LRYRVTYADALLASGQATTAPSTVDEFIQSRLNGAVEFALW
jgi:hypothetical protein